MSQFPLARILEFVRQVAPFETLESEELDRIVQCMSVTYFPHDEVIIQAGGEPSQNLFIIMSGSVKISIPEETDNHLLVDMRGEGDVFGAVSILQSRQALFSVTVVEDVIAFVLPAQDFRNLVERHPAFKRHFSFPLAQNLKAVRRLADRNLSQITGTESLGRMAQQMRSRVGELMSSPVLTCTPDTSIRQAAQLMTENRRGSVVIKNGSDEPLGLITDTDMRSRVLSAMVDPARPVSEVMSSPVLTVSPRAFAYEALLEMTRNGVHHLVVCEEGRMKGVLSDHDIKIITGSSPVSLAQEIDKVQSTSQLAKLQSGIGQVLEMLMRLGNSADFMTAVVTEFNDRLTLKLRSLTEAAMIDDGLGPAPANFSWFVAGCAGRSEQVPPAKQLFSLVYQDLHLDKESSVRTWYVEFSHRMLEGLVACGLTPVPGTVNQDMPRNCQSSSSWQRSFENWISHPEQADHTAMAKLLDFRPIEGESHFARSTRQAIFRHLDSNPSFLGFLAQAAIDLKPPLGFFRGLVLERDGHCKDSLDLEETVLRPMVDAIRVLALDQRIETTNTLARIDRLIELDLLDQSMAADLKGTFSFITSLCITKFLESRSDQAELRGYVDPVGLNSVQRKMLKASFGVIDNLQSLLFHRYGLHLDST